MAMEGTKEIIVIIVNNHNIYNGGALFFFFLTMLCLISAVQQSDSVIHIYSFPYSFPLWFITGY